MARPGGSALLSGLLLWLLSLVVVAVIVTQSGLVAAPFGVTAALLGLGGGLLYASLSFVRYYGDEDRRLL